VVIECKTMEFFKFKIYLVLVFVNCIEIYFSNLFKFFLIKFPNPSALSGLLHILYQKALLNVKHASLVFKVHFLLLVNIPYTTQINSFFMLLALSLFAYILTVANTR
jgi:hypothetical protein